MLLRVFTFCIVFLGITAAWAMAGSDSATARKFISGLGDRVVSIFQENKAAPEREKALTELFNKTIDAEWMGKFVMGRYWKQASNEQKQRFLKLYREFLIINYLPHFRNYSGEKQQVLAVIDERDGDYLVRTQIIRPTKDTPFHVDYRVHKKDASSFYIFDIVTEGVSVVTTHRSDFGSVIAREGIDGLMQRLQSKIHAAKASVVTG